MIIGARCCISPRLYSCEYMFLFFRVSHLIFGEVCKNKNKNLPLVLYSSVPGQVVQALSSVESTVDGLIVFSLFRP